MKKILYLGWIGYNNLGDELMWELFKKHFEEQNLGQSMLVPSVPEVDTGNLSEYDSVVLGGGSLLIPGYTDLAHRALLAGKQVCIWGSGYDRLDGSESWEPVKEWVDDKMAAQIADLAAGSVYFGVRGPLTYRLLKSAGIPMGRIFVSGDSGLLLPGPRAGAKPAADKTIAINWGTTYNKLLGKNELQVEDALAAAAREWVQQGCRLYLYPVWGPDRGPLERLAGKIGNQPAVEVERRLLGAAEVIDRLSGCRLSVNFKLHANMLSLAAEVPFISLGYRFKCFDFAESVGMSDLILPTNAPDLTLRLRNKAAALESRREEFVRRMLLHRDNYRKKLLAPFHQHLI
ncbi:polysaccharide pyruvyl transferase family protein [Paenibacillus pinistramenti]|uniref:polysaccharide pyruvyl transferase family protein n=1 Tax=Paenibacillus pinistramenti TaxID=1768003 RepID=UPI001109F21E|nr:polysaccharide pyruvyl transferase family protein [Paenibacillus pinistramenti]